VLRGGGGELLQEDAEQAENAGRGASYRRGMPCRECRRSVDDACSTVRRDNGVNVYVRRAGSVEMSLGDMSASTV